MGLIDTYFGGDWDNYRSYYGDDWQTQYRYVLTFVDDSETVLLKENPVGWDNFSVKFLRNWTYFTVWRNFALSLKFPKTNDGGGIRILQSETSYGIMANTTVDIYERVPQTGDYDIVYTGALEYKPGKYREERDFVVCSITDSNIEDKIKTREDIKYNVFDNISSDGIAMPDIPNFTKSIVFNKIDIFGFTEGNIRQINTLNWNIGNDGDVITTGVKALTTDLIKNELGNRLGILVNDINNDASQVLYNNTTTSETEVSVNWERNNTFIENGTISFILITGNSTARLTITKEINRYDDGDNLLDSVSGSQIVEFAFQRTLPVPAFAFNNVTMKLNPGDRLEYVIKLKGEFFAGPGSDARLIYTGNNEFEINTLREISLGEPDTFVDVVMPDELLSRLSQLTTSQLDTNKLFYSPELGRLDSPFQTYAEDGEFSKTGVTKGKIIRRYPNEPLNISLKETFQIYNGIGNYCLWYDRANERIQVTTKDFAFDKTYFMFDLGEVTKWSREPMSRAYFNKIVGGWKTQSNESINGGNEYNAKAEYSEVSTVKNEYKVQIPINGDGTSMEYLRRFPFRDYASTDTRWDGNLYVIDTDLIQTIQGGGNIEGYENVESNYNARITPRKNLAKHGSVLLTSLFNNSNPVRFNSRDKNTNVTYDDSFHGRVSENDDITKDELVAKGYGRLFEPFIYKFEKDVNRTILNILRINGNGYFKFTFEGVVFESFIDIVDIGDYPRDGKWTGIAKAISEGDNKVFENENNHVLENVDNRILE